jgi:diguanylate cyclase (GGDEF)-like protein
LKILIADDDPINRRLLEAFLVKHEYQVILARDGQQAWEMLRAPDAPKLAILDWSMPGKDGPQICRELRKLEGTDYVYVLLLTSMSQEAEMVEGLEAGADDYLTKPFKGPQLKARLRTGKRILALQEQLRSANEALHFQLAHDALTGVFSRAAIMEKLLIELTRALRQKSTVGILMADLDRFKSINDTYGHLTGDFILREAAKRMRASIRPYDAVGRCGGEEFLIIMPGCDAASAMARAEELRKAIGNAGVEAPEGKIALTISLGVTVGSDPEELEFLLRAADAALYDAKHGGRNRVVLSAQLGSTAHREANESAPHDLREGKARQVGGLKDPQ